MIIAWPAISVCALVSYLFLYVDHNVISPCLKIGSTCVTSYHLLQTQACKNTATERVRCFMQSGPTNSRPNLSANILTFWV